MQIKGTDVEELGEGWSVRGIKWEGRGTLSLRLAIGKVTEEEEGSKSFSNLNTWRKFDVTEFTVDVVLPKRKESIVNGGEDDEKKVEVDRIKGWARR